MASRFARVCGAVRSALSNCGGTNRRGSRFAGRLGSPDLSDDELVAICHSLILPNGVRKTTAPSRNSIVVERLVRSCVLELPSSVRVLDVGASIGLDAKATCDALQRATHVSEYVLGDLYTKVLYDRERGLVYDEDGQLLQVRRGGGFVSIYFSYNYFWQRLTNMPKRVRPALLRRRYPFDPARPVAEAALVHPSLRIGEPASPFRLRRLDVFEPLRDEWFDLIVCMHLLVPRYFDDATRRRGVAALASMLRPGATLLVGATESFDLVRRPARGGTLDTLSSRQLGFS